MNTSNFKSSLLKLAICHYNGNVVNRDELVRSAAKESLKRMLHNNSCQAYQEKKWLRKAAITGNYYDLPSFVMDLIQSYHVAIWRIEKGMTWDRISFNEALNDMN